MFDKVIGHEKIKKDLKKIERRIPVTSLFIGPKGVGKKYLIYQFLDELYKGVLSNNLLEHPDIYFFEPKPKTKTFKIDTVKEIQKTLYTTSFELDKKFYILKNVDWMNKEAANACLKMFEECPRDIHFLLTAENDRSILETILSRSIVFRLNPVPNLRQHFPNKSDLEIKLLNGCIGKEKDLEDLVSNYGNLEDLFESVEKFLISLKEKSYAEVVEWFFNFKEKIDSDINYSLLLDILSIVVINLVKSDRNEFCFIVKELGSFKHKISMNLNLDLHFKNWLIQIKRRLEEETCQNPLCS